MFAPAHGFTPACAQMGVGGGQQARSPGAGVDQAPAGDLLQQAAAVTDDDVSVSTRPCMSF